MNKVLPGQNIVDKAIELTGDASGAFALALANGLSLTDKLVPGTVLKTVGVRKSRMKLELDRRKVNPATASTYTHEPDRIFREEFFEEME